MSILAAAPALLALVLSDEAPPAPAPSEARLLGGAVDVRIDLARGVLELRADDGARIASVPVAAAVLPSRPPRRYGYSAEHVQTLPAEDELEAAAGAIQGALLRLRAGDPSEPPVTVGIRGGPFGPLVTYSFPRRAFAGLSHRVAFDGAGRVTVGRTPSGGRTRVAGEDAGMDAVVAATPARIRLLVGEDFASLPLRALRLRGSLGVDDRSEEGADASLRVLVDGVDVGRTEDAARGEPAREFDVPLRDGREVTFELDAGGGAAEALAVLQDVRFEGAGGDGVALAELLRSDRSALLLLDGLGKSSDLVPRAPEPDPAREGVAWIDATRSEGAGVAPGPLLLPFEAPGGWLVGVGLMHLPDATRFGSDGDGVVLEVPTHLLASEPAATEEEEGLERTRVILAVVAARSMRELYERYRTSLIAAGGSATRRVVGSLTAPPWWRHPLLYCAPPPGRGRFGRFDVHEVEKRIRDVETRLGLSDFSVVIDGPWMSRAGDPRPSEDFARLKVLTSAQHVQGRHVLLRWPLFAAEPGSLADVVGAQANGRLRATEAKKVEAFLHEVVRACIGEGLHRLGADGFLLSGTSDLLDPARDAAVGDLDPGVGLRELGWMLRRMRLEVDARELEGALLAAPCALPQLVTDHGAIVFDPAGDRETREARLERIVAAVPDLPVMMRPLEAAPADVLDWCARAVAIGVPAVGSRTLVELSDEEAAALGAILGLASARPLGNPRRDGDDWRMEYEGRLLAQTLPDRAGVAVFPRRGAALVALTRAGDALLPFRPVAVEGEASVTVEFAERGSVLVGGTTGVVYRLRTE